MVKIKKKKEKEKVIYKRGQLKHNIETFIYVIFSFTYMNMTYFKLNIYSCSKKKNNNKIKKVHNLKQHLIILSKTMC